MARLTVSFALTLFVAFTGTLAMAQEITVELVQQGNLIAVGDRGTLKRGGTINIPRNETRTIAVTCTGFSCTTVVAQVQGAQGEPVDLGIVGTHDSTTAKFDLVGADLAAGVNSALLLKREDVASVLAQFQIIPSGDPPPDQAAGGVTLSYLLTRNCLADATGARLVQSYRNPRQNLSPYPFYSEPTNLAHFLVTPLGTVVARPGGVIDENDRIEVAVLADERLISRLIVNRASTVRDVTLLSLAGAGSTIPAGVIRQTGGAEAAPRPPICMVQPYFLTDFAPGEGKIALTAIDTDGTETTRTVSFVVNRLYWGALSFGGMWSTLEDYTFKLSKQDTTTVIAQDRVSGNRHDYVLLVTPFVSGRRDFEKPTSLYRRLSPSLGFVLNDITNNLLGGVSLDISSGVFLTAGIHLGRVRELSGGATVGSAFQGSTDEIPVRERSVAKPFYAASIDLRAAVQAITAALSGTAGTAR